ncbi:MAG TPA: condensation domain-containing protein, partial [Pyrinomonadaceae bacterium]
MPVPVGVAGELYLGGDGLAVSYLNRPGLTAEKFVPDPFGGMPGARLYRTGDLARHLADGQIEFIGRIDNQVKIRGFRIELGEIEAALNEHESVRECVVLAREDVPGERRLVAYLVGAPEPAIGDIRAYLKGRLPDYMMPSFFVVLDELPLTINGKVDRRHLPEPELNGDDERAPAAARTATEEIVAGIYGQALRLAAVDAEANFFEIGGHSLLATQVMSRIRETFKVELPLRTLFQHPTVRELSRKIEEALHGEHGIQSPPMARAPRDEALPLSFAQQRLWFMAQLGPGGSSYNVPVAVRLKGALDLTALERTLSEIVRRHEVLRTTFAVVDGEPVQVIHDARPVSLPVTDLSALDESERESEAARLAGEEAGRPFDLGAGPLVRAGLLRLSAEEHVCLLTVHHIVSDGWSMGVLINEVAALYDAFSSGGESPLPELEAQYADYAVWQRQWLQGDVLDKQLSYWRERLAGAPAALELPTDRQRPRRTSFRGGKYFVTFPGPLSERLKELGNQVGVTLFMTLLAAFQTLLSHYTRSDDIVVGTDVANRNRGETEALIGFFVNQLVLRTDLSGNPTFRELLVRVRETALGAYAHQDLPFEQLVEAVGYERGSQRPPLFQVKLALQNAPADELELKGLTLGQFDYERESAAAKLDLTLLLSDGAGGLGVHFGYNADLFDEAAVARMARRFRTLLEAAVSQPDTGLNELGGLLLDEERRERSEVMKRRDESGVLKLKSVKPKRVGGLDESLVRTSSLPAGGSLPLVVEPRAGDLDLAAWAKANLAFVETKLARHGAILFRGFKGGEADGFERFAQATGTRLFKDNGEHPRKSVSGNVYTPTFYPPEEKVLWHNENSFNHEWPTKLWFCCVVPAREGGETPVVDSRRVLESIDAEVRERFAAKGVMYVRNYGRGLGLGWQEVFKTSQRAEVEARCRKGLMEFEWTGEGHLTTRAVRPAVVTHPRTGEPTWFNQAQHWHPSCLNPATRASMQALFSDERLPRNCYYGDGAPIEDSVMQHILGVYQRLEVSF